MRHTFIRVKGRIEKPLIFAMIGIITLAFAGVGFTPPKSNASDDSSYSCKLYGAQDNGDGDSQFFTAEKDSGSSNLGPEYSKADVEASDIHPVTETWYVIAGDNGFIPQLHTIDKATGVNTKIADISGLAGLNELPSASFHPNGTLYAWAENEGLYTIDINTGLANLEYTPGSGIDDNWEGLAWNPEGTFLYGADGNELYKYDPNTGTATSQCTNLPNPTEALEFNQEGELIGAQHNSNQLFIVDPETCGLSSTDYVTSQQNDIESITFLCEDDDDDNNNPCEDNEAPVAVVDPSSTQIVLGESFTFNGDSSYDNDGDDLTYSWTIDGTNITSDESSITFTPENEGAYTLHLTVADACTSHEASATLVVSDSDDYKITNQCTDEFGYNVVAAGVGLEHKTSGTISINIPGPVEKALLYWNGMEKFSTNGDANIKFDGNAITGEFIGAEGNKFKSIGYRKDVTNFMSQGSNTYTVSDVEFGSYHHGASLVVAYRDSNADPSHVEINDFVDYFYVGYQYAPLGTDSEVRTIPFDPGTVDRTVDMYILAGGSDTSNPHRGDNIWFSTETSGYLVDNPLATQIATDFAQVHDGGQWDTFFISAPIEAGATFMNTQLESPEDEHGESLTWIAQTITLPLDCPSDNCDGNRAPVADIAPLDQIITVGETLTFDASGSTDADGDVLTFAWDVVGTGITGIPSAPTFDFSAAQPGTYTIKVTASDDCTSDSAETTVTVIPESYCYLEIVKTADKDVVTPSEALGYTVTVTNEGDADCTTVELKEFYDTQIVFSDSTPSPDNPENTLWNVGTLAPTESFTVNIDTTVSENAQQGDILHNEACTWAEELGDKNDTNNWICAWADTTVIEGDPEPTTLELYKYVTDRDETLEESNSAVPSELMTYTVKVQNTGNEDALSVLLEDNYDENYISILDTDGGTDTNGIITWNLGTIQALGFVIKQIEVQVDGSIDQFLTFYNFAEATANNANTANDSVTTAVEPPVNDPAILQVLKTVTDLDETNVSANTAYADEELTYTITVTNIGGETAINASLVDNYDQDKLVILNDGGGIDDSDTINYSLGNIAPGANVTKTIVGQIFADVPAGTELDNVALATADNTDSDQDSTTTTVIDEPPVQIDLALTKEVDNAEVFVGDQVVFTITLTNEGTVDASGITVSDVLPQELTYISDDTSDAYDETTGIWTVGELATGESVSMQITVEATEEGEFINTAQVETASEEDVDSTPGNDVEEEDDQDSASVSASTPSEDTLDLELTKSVSAGKVDVDKNVTFTTTVFNAGNNDATGVVVKDNLSHKLTYLSDDAGGAFDSTTEIWTVGDLAVGESKSFNMLVKVGEPGTFTNWAEITEASGPYSDIDSTPNNHVPTEDDQDSATVIGDNGGGGCCIKLKPEINIVKNVSVAFTNPGQIIEYTFKVTNPGSKTAQDVEVVDTLPDGFTFVDGGSATKTWDLGSLNSSDSTSVTYEVKVGDDIVDGHYDNLAVVTISNGTPPTNRDEDSARVEVKIPVISGEPRLEMEKVVSTSFTNPDSIINYTVTVQNVTNYTAINVTVDDILPGGFTFVEGGGNTKTYSLGDMQSGEIKTITYDVKVAETVEAGFYDNFATADADNTPPVSDSERVEVRKPIVAGITLLPDTGIESGVSSNFAGIALTLMSTGALFIARRKEEFAGIKINFVQ